jgi:hypothetical protein
MLRVSKYLAVYYFVTTNHTFTYTPTYYKELLGTTYHSHLRAYIPS